MQIVSRKWPFKYVLPRALMLTVSQARKMMKDLSVNIAAEKADLFQAEAVKRDQEILAIMPLETIVIKLKPLNHNVLQH
jgi:hypothetical protein